MDFVAIDVETANPDMASICQIGVVAIVNGLVAEEWMTYVDPEDYFDSINSSIHGISERTVVGAPTFAEICDLLHLKLHGRVAVCHTHFDRTAVHQAVSKCGASIPEVSWLDSARIARRTWESCARKGYGLASVCKMLGYKFKHHDALEDAKAAAHIVVTACEETGLTIGEWLKRVNQPIYLHASSRKGDRIDSKASARREANPDGMLYGEVVVFTGALEMPRTQAADLAAQIGCQVDSNVTRRTTMLVVGDYDVRALAGHHRSAKHRKAEDLIKNGLSIRILKETDFHRLVESSASRA